MSTARNRLQQFVRHSLRRIGYGADVTQWGLHVFSYSVYEGAKTHANERMSHCCDASYDPFLAQQWYGELSSPNLPSISLNRKEISGCSRWVANSVQRIDWLWLDLITIPHCLTGAFYQTCSGFCSATAANHKTCSSQFCTSLQWST